MLLGLGGPACGLHAAQTCDAAASTAAVRFDRNDDGTVTDRRSHLMWARCSAGQAWAGNRCEGPVSALDFRSALDYADDVNRSGALFWSDWRLPRASELATIAERGCRDPRIDLTLFPDTPPAFYWTTTMRPRPAEGHAFALSFGPEGIRDVDQQQAAHLRLVRDAR